MATALPPQIHELGEGNRYLNMCFCAESGFGKTVTLGSAGEKMLILSSDPEGTDSAYYQGSGAKEWICRDYDDIDEAYRWIRDKNNGRFDYVGMDSAPEFQRILQRTWLDKNKGNAGKRDPDVLGMDGYQITQNQFIRFVKQFNDLPVHTVWTAQPMQLEDAEGEVYYLPNIHGQKGDVAQQFKGYMKIVGFGSFVTKKVKKKDGTVEEKIVRRYHFQPYSGYKGKDRTDSLGAYKDDITLPEIVEIAGKKAEAATRPAAANKVTATRRRTAKRA